MINNYNWEGISNPWKSEDWKRFLKNNRAIALNVMYIKEKEICPVFISNHNLNYEKQKLFLMIPNEEKEVGIIFLLKSISTFTMVIIVVQIVFILLQ